MIESVLVRAASIAVMLHMAIGCSWHHGISPASACNDACTSSSCHYTAEEKPTIGCCHDHDGHDDHSKDSDPEKESGHDGPDAPANHLCCCDDGCNAIQAVEFVFDALDFSTAYMGGTGNSVIIEAALNPNVLVDPFPDCSNTAQKLRTHLLLNVQIL